jgi:CRISPR/Cas system CSM-associated protein Csm3 (group 7 of RAMP superfamily)
MTDELRLTIDIRSYWHVASGGSNAYGADGVVRRDALGLPFLPGRAVKGLLRDACTKRNTDDEKLRKLFGKGDRENPTDVASQDFDAGVLRFSDARIDEKSRAYLAARPEAERKALAAGLYRTAHMTAMDANGAVKETSLRSVEVSVPVALETSISAAVDPGFDWRAAIKDALPLITGLGAFRTRGYGQCFWRATEAAA